MIPPEALDPRSIVIADRIADVRRVICVSGSKGGIGKSVVASLLALTLADQGRRVGLFDLDFTSPSDHVVLGLDRRFPGETFGIDPHRVEGIDMMSVAFFAGGAPAPLRGADTSSALLELLAITQWGELDVLVLDMPPGLGDLSLDVIRWLPAAEFLLVANASRLVVDSVRRALALLTELDAPLTGMLENMRRGDAGTVAELAATFDVPFLGAVPFDETFERAVGDPDRLRATPVYRAIHDAVADVIG